MITFKDFLRWYNIKDVVPTLGAKKKLIEFTMVRELTYCNWGARFQTLQTSAYTDIQITNSTRSLKEKTIYLRKL